MRRLIFVLTLLLLAANAQATGLKSPTDLYQESEKLLANKHSKDEFAKKAKDLASLEKTFDETLNAYEKQVSKEAEIKEKEILLMFSYLEPAFKLAKEKTVTEDDCERKKQEIRTGNSMGRGENPPLTAPAKEALNWLEYLCEGK